MYGGKYFSRIPSRWCLSWEMKCAVASLMCLQDTFDRLDIDMNKFGEKYKTYIYRYFDANSLQ